MKKLNNDQIVGIFYDVGSLTYFKNTYDVDIRTVKNIKAQRSHKHITLKLKDPGQIIKYGLSPDDVEYIYISNLPYTELATKFKVHVETIRNIKKGRTRAYEEWF